jgi:hypothetical protein
MKLSDILTERLSAEVYSNLDKSLTVINSVFQNKHFMINYGTPLDGPCLLSQIIYTIASVTGISVKKITDSLSREWIGDLKSLGAKGMTLQEIIDQLHNTIII